MNNEQKPKEKEVDDDTAFFIIFLLLFVLFLLYKSDTQNQRITKLEQKIYQIEKEHVSPQILETLENN